MAFRELNPRLDIDGFYECSTANILTGRLLKHIASKNNPFYLVQLAAPCYTQIRDPKNAKKLLRRSAKANAVVGLSDSHALHDLREHIGHDIRVQFVGTTPSKNYPGKHIKLFKVEVDDSTPAEHTIDDTDASQIT